MQFDPKTFLESALSIGCSTDRPASPTTQTKYGLYLTFASSSKGVFCYPVDAVTFEVGGRTVKLAARHADSLELAERYYLSARDFSSIEDAVSFGKRLRECLIIENLFYGMGLIFSFEDVGPPEPWRVFHSPEDFNEGVQAGVEGLWAYRQDVKTPAGSMFGFIDVKPTNISYQVEGVKNIWPVARAISESDQPAVALLNAAAIEKIYLGANFLLTYAALVTLVPPKRRDANALEVLKNMKNVVRLSRLPEKEKNNFFSFIGMARNESQKEAFVREFSEFQPADRIEGATPLEIILQAYDIRNTLSHPADARLPEHTERLARSMRRIAFLVIAKRNGLFPLTLEDPKFSMVAPSFSLDLLQP